MESPAARCAREDVEPGRSEAEAVADGADPERAVLGTAVGG